MKQTLLFLLLLSVLTGFSQKRKKVLIESKSEIIETARKELDEAMKAPEGAIYLFATGNQLEGEYTFDITVHEKGKVASVFCAERKEGTIKMQNKLKDFIKDFQFYFKMPKGKRYKFTYKFKFN